MTSLRAFSILLVTLLFSVVHAEQLDPFTDLEIDGQMRLFDIQGSNTIGAAMAPALVAEYMKAKGATDVKVESAGVENEKLVTGYIQSTRTRLSVGIAAHGSGTGFKGLLNSDADIAAASRPVKDKEAKMLRRVADMRSPDSEHIVGIDGLAIIVNKTNPVSELSVDEIAEIFSGGYTDWSELGGRPGPIKVYARDSNSGTWDSFKGMVLGKAYKLLDSAERFESNDQLSASVSADPNGIGFVGLASVNESKLVAVSDGSAKALKPNKLTVATEDYALSRRLFLYTDDEIRNPYAAEFIQFALADNGQQVVADAGFISQELKAVMPEFYADLPDDFRALTDQARRLTINFRFQQGSAKLDNKALRDIERLVDYLQHQRTAEVVLIGFGDKKRTERRSKLLSKLRAMAVRRELVRNGIYPKESVGYGEYLPVASANREEGRMKNRRVEVWVKDNS